MSDWYMTRAAELVEENRVYRALIADAARALKRTGIGGIYAGFTDLADAIGQMGSHIKEQRAERDALQEQLDKWRKQRGRISHWLSSLRIENETCRGQLKLAEGLAEALEESVHTEQTLRDRCAGYPGWSEWEDAAEIGRKALTAWRAAGE